MIERGVNLQSIKEKLEEIVYDSIEGNSYSSISTIDGENFFVEVEGGNYYISEAKAYIYGYNKEAKNISKEIDCEKEIELDIDRINVWLEEAEKAAEDARRTEDCLTDYYWRTRL